MPHGVADGRPEDRACDPVGSLTAPLARGVRTHPLPILGEGSLTREVAVIACRKRADELPLVVVLGAAVRVATLELFKHHVVVEAQGLQHAAAHGPRTAKSSATMDHDVFARRPLAGDGVDDGLQGDGACGHAAIGDGQAEDREAGTGLGDEGRDAQVHELMRCRCRRSPFTSRLSFSGTRKRDHFG